MSTPDLGTLELERIAYQHLLDRLTGLPKWGLLIDHTTLALARAFGVCSWTPA